MAIKPPQRGNQTSEADIQSSYSRLIARELGLSARQLPKLLCGTGLNVKQFLIEDSLLSVHQQILILRNALTLSERSGFGLRLGSRLTPATHGVVGVVAYSSPDLLSALQAFQAFLPTRASFIELHLHQIDDRLECIASFQVQLDEDIERCLAEAVIKSFFEIGEFIVGSPLYETDVYFRHPPPPYQDFYSDYLPGSIHFGCAQLKLTFPMALCRVANASANNENYRLAFKQCELMLARLQNHKPNYQTLVKKLMLSHPAGALCEEEAAAALFMGKRTLSRKLKEENSSFRQVRDEILSRRAATYLRDTQLSVEAIALLLGYHDTASFRRAFKRWFVMPPVQYRKCNGTDKLTS
ncbi:AraC family transcriptional regulator ligand-binding domain-containing protein [Paraperlucidibaca wandonensis]|jgi:AraC-like DNA-binding protein|uniref:AraC family transcriptional regulator ligand-binding domain-containing protein n=1 Tax=Paraperlucidibaca wandonensis TaxID=1268273 RepID=A0ABW3HH44_9GAMM